MRHCFIHLILLSCLFLAAPAGAETSAERPWVPAENTSVERDLDEPSVADPAPASDPNRSRSSLSEELEKNPPAAGEVVLERLLLSDGDCGNDQCEVLDGEDRFTCPADCDTCGNGTCDYQETRTNCATDCARCGDGYCSSGESGFTCPEDCSCGNGICESGEPFSCHIDCPL